MHHAAWSKAVRLTPGWLVIPISTLEVSTRLGGCREAQMKQHCPHPPIWKDGNFYTGTVDKIEWAICLHLVVGEDRSGVLVDYVEEDTLEAEKLLPLLHLLVGDVVLRDFEAVVDEHGFGLDARVVRGSAGKSASRKLSRFDVRKTHNVTARATNFGRF